MKNNNLTILTIALFLLCNSTAYTQNIDFYSINNKTGNLQFYESKTFLASILSNKEKKTNLQFGYSPFKHFSVSSAYIFGHTAEDGGLESKSDGELVFTVGGYYFFPLSLKSELSKKLDILGNKRGILVNVKTGYSRSKIQHSLVGVESSSSVNYNTMFLQFGCYYKFKLGQIGMTLIMNRLKYKTIEIRGQDYPEQYDNDIGLNFDDESVYKPTSINVEGQLGIKAMKFIYGGTFISGNFLDSFVLRGGQPYVYAGLVFEIGGQKREPIPLIRVRDLPAE